MTTTNTDVVIRGHNAFRKSVTQCRKMGAVDRLLARNRRLLVLLARSSNLFLIPIASAIPSYGRRRLFCFYYVPLSRCPSQYPMPTSTFFISLRTNNERMSTKLAEGTHYRRQMNSLHFRWNYTRNKGAGYGRKFELTSNGAATNTWFDLNRARSVVIERSCHIPFYWYFMPPQSTACSGGILFSFTMSRCSVQRRFVRRAGKTITHMLLRTHEMITSGFSSLIYSYFCRAQLCYGAT